MKCAHSYYPHWPVIMCAWFFFALCISKLASTMVRAPSNLGLPLPVAAVASAQTASARTTVHLGFLAMGQISVVKSTLVVVRQICSLTSAGLIMHLVTDVDADASALRRGVRSRCGNILFRIYDVRRLPPTQVEQFRALSGAFRLNGYFMLKPMAHEIIPPEVDRIIFMDSDVVPRDDIVHLWEEFDKFDDSQMLGMALAQDLVYRGCRFPPHEGTKTFQGFNGGLQLLRLDRMRRNSHYNALITPETWPGWFHANKSVCGWHVYGEWSYGDQDFYNLLSGFHREWYHTVPCNWNIQVCSAWSFGVHPEMYRDWPQVCEARPSLLHMCGEYKTLLTPQHELVPCEVLKHHFRLGLEKAPTHRAWLAHLCGEAGKPGGV
mmetsp:Transcript_126415/g.393435  ORF Transcript_126415/g.393435 Transcript_126415/m.393435 type:complete len:378 (+) Transcript_126415:61-1194(+)